MIKMKIMIVTVMVVVMMMMAIPNGGDTEDD